MTEENRPDQASSVEKEYNFLLESSKSINLLELISNAFYWVDNSLQNCLRKNGWPNITRLQSQVLTCLGAGFLRTADIARHMGVSRQVVNRCVTDLVNEGLLELNADPSDKRASIIVPTLMGKSIVICAAQSFEGIEKVLRARLGTKKLKQLREILELEWGEPVE